MSKTTPIIDLYRRYQAERSEALLSELLTVAEPMIRAVAVSAMPRSLPSHLDREDLVSEARVSALKAVHTFRGNCEGFPDYLAVSCRNAVLRTLRDTYRRKRGVSETLGGLSSEIALRTCEDPSPNPSEALEKAELIELALAHLETLPARDREIVSAHYLRGETDSEISERLGLSRVTVTNRRLRALEHLRTQID